MQSPPPPEQGGGRGPRKILPLIPVVEPAPSHDGVPCFTAYTVDAEHTDRPHFALRIYDTTPAAGDPARARDLALKIYLGTKLDRYNYEAVAPMEPNDSAGRDRIELVGLPLPRDASDDQRVQACTAHHMAELAARRQRVGWGGFYLPATFDACGWWRAIVVIDRLEEGWEGAALGRPWPRERVRDQRGRAWAAEDPYGSFLYVQWELTELARREMEEMEEVWDEVAVAAYPILKLGRSLGDLREHMGGFGCFASEGGLEKHMMGPEIEAGFSCYDYYLNKVL